MGRRTTEDASVRRLATGWKREHQLVNAPPTGNVLTLAACGQSRDLTIADQGAPHMLSPPATPVPSDESTTRASLLVRIRDPQDADAWAQFNRIYGPLVFRFARKHGFQDSDAADLTQEVLREVCRNISRFDYDPELGRFRGWLLTIARYTLSRMRKSKARQPHGTGDTETIRQLESVADDAGSMDQDWNEEYERTVFEWAAKEVRGHVLESTWEAFHRTTVEGRKPIVVARELGMSVGSVYVARNRVLTRLKEQISEVEE